MEPGEQMALLLDLHSMDKRRRREAARKREAADMVAWSVVEQSTKWASIVAEDSLKHPFKKSRAQIQVEEITSSVDSPASTPKPRRRDFSKLDLLAPLNIPIGSPSSIVLEAAKQGKLIDNPDPMRAHPPAPPPPPMIGKASLRLPVPAFRIRSATEARSTQLQSACYAQPTALLQGLPAAVGMDLSEFSAKALVRAAPEQRVEVRTQRRMSPAENVDVDSGLPSWFCRSSRSHVSIREFAQYQASSNLASLEEKTFKKPVSQAWGLEEETKEIGSYPEIKFGTNIDLSDSKVWGKQLGEIAKLPEFLTLHSAVNLLSHLGHEVLGMNTVQLYMKVPGCRTPGHQENLNFASVNVNVGPGDCVWVVTGQEYWGQLEGMCRSRGLDYLKGSWWPPLSDLEEAGIPYYLYTQKAGDTVWIGPGAVHWVQAEGHCVNIAWNTGVISEEQLELSCQRYEWNKLAKYHSIVPLVQLSWRLAADLLGSKDARLRQAGLLRRLHSILLKSLHYQQRCLSLLDELGMKAMDHPWKSGDPAAYCRRCDEEVFNVLLAAPDENGDNWVYCFYCALRHRPDLAGYSALIQFPLKSLAATADLFARAPLS